MKKLIFAIALLACGLCSSAASKQNDSSDYTDKNKEAYNVQRGRELLIEKNEAEAFEAFSREIKENPKNGYAYTWLAYILEENNEHGRALELLNKAIKLLPKKDVEYQSFVLNNRANVLIALDDTIGALKDINKAISINPDDDESYFLRAKISYDMGNLEQAEADFLKLQELKPTVVVALAWLAQIEKDRNNPDKALQYLDRAIKLQSDYGYAYSEKAYILFSQNKLAEAADNLVEALKYNSRDAIKQLVFLSEDEVFPVETKLKIQSAKEPLNYYWLYILGTLSQAQLNFPKAIEYYKKGYEMEPSPDFLYRIIRCYYQLNDFKNVIDYTDRYIDLMGDDAIPDIYESRSRAMFELKGPEAAIAEMDKFLEYEPEEYFGYYRRGWYKHFTSDVDGAIEDLKVAILLNPEYAYSYLTLGDMLMKKGEEGKALEQYGKIIELDSVPDSNSCAMYAFLALGEKEKAFDFMDKVIQADSTYAGNYYDAACLYARAGEPQKALDYLEQAFSMGYNRFNHVLLDEDLQSLHGMPEFQALIDKYKSMAEAGEEPGFEVIVEEAQEEMVPQQPVSIPFSRENGVTKVTCSINGLPLYFVFDTGAADVTLSQVEANFMMKNNYLTKKDVIGSNSYMDANGNVSVGTVVNLGAVDFGGVKLENVRASVVRNQRAPLLLGQTVLSRLGKIEIDNASNNLIITPYNN